MGTLLVSFITNRMGADLVENHPFSDSMIAPDRNVLFSSDRGGNLTKSAATLPR
jgi:hypothetical protein